MRDMKLPRVIALALLTSCASIGVAGAQDPPDRIEAGSKSRGDNRSHALADKQNALRRRGLEMKLRGQARQDARVVEVAKGQYVELAREKTDKIFVVIAEFGNTRHVAFPDSIGGVPQSNALTFDG